MEVLPFKINICQKTWNVSRETFQKENYEKNKTERTKIMFHVKRSKDNYEKKKRERKNVSRETLKNTHVEKLSAIDMKNMKKER